MTDSRKRWTSWGFARWRFTSGISGGWWRCSFLPQLILYGTPLSGLGAAAPNAQVFSEVVRQARELAGAPWKSHEMVLPQALEQLDYDTYRIINFRREEGLWFDDSGRFQVQFFHPGYIYKQRVEIYEVDHGQTRPVTFSPKFFRYHQLEAAAAASASDDTLGFAGFRLLYPLNHTRPVDEVISFLGSSYFRALAAGQVYGISARGLAVDTAENLPEEFPAFRAFWLCKPSGRAREMQFFALLDSQSVSGAYRFLIRPGRETTVEIENHLFFRKPVQVLGLAPLTSMFWRDEHDPLPPKDKRPEVHDSDTLIIRTNKGESKVQPLQQVERVTTQLFPENNPQGFGLLQRDRNPAHYGDDEAKYSRRPSVMVESLGEWGPGSVHLLQLPTANEYSDNVVAFWEPEKKFGAGEELEFKYRLRWFTRESNKH